MVRVPLESSTAAEGINDHAQGADGPAPIGTLLFHAESGELSIMDRVLGRALTVSMVLTSFMASAAGGVLILERLGIITRPSLLPLTGTEQEALPVNDWQQYALAGHRRGPPDARVTVIEFGDYECSACLSAEPHLKALRRRYPDDVQFIYRHWPLPYHQYALPTARAAECAGEQGRFWEYHERLYSDRNWLGDAIYRFAEESGIEDLAAFRECFLRTDPVPATEADMAAAQAAGGTGTPTLIVNGLMIRSNFDSLTLFQMVDDALSRKP
jgi:predicted DsbA family dithiol-disulfide isomerase